MADVWAEHVRWPLTTPPPGPSHAAARPRGAPPYVSGRPIGLFAAYGRSPRPFAIDDVAALDVFARAVTVLALDRFRDAAALPASPISVAVGVLMERHRLDAGDALALLRARAYATDTTLPTLAAALLAGHITITV